MIDDDELIRDSMEMIFTDLGFEVKTCGDGEKGVALAMEFDYDLILCDMRMPGLNGAQAVAKILQAKPGCASSSSRPFREIRWCRRPWPPAPRA